MTREGLLVIAPHPRRTRRADRHPGQSSQLGEASRVSSAPSSGARAHPRGVHAAVGGGGQSSGGGGPNCLTTMTSGSAIMGGRRAQVSLDDIGIGHHGQKPCYRARQSGPEIGRGLRSTGARQGLSRRTRTTAPPRARRTRKNHPSRPAIDSSRSRVLVRVTVAQAVFGHCSSSAGFAPARKAEKF